MGTPCGLQGNYPYAAKHDPFVYFNDINGWDGTTFQPSARCNAHVVDYSQFDADLAAGKLPKYVFITPNLIDDMHDGSIAQGDAWLAKEVPKILASDAFNNGGVLFLTWDEGGGYPQSDDPPFIVISPNAKRGYVSQTPFDTSSYLKTVQTILGIQSLPCDPKSSGVQTMDEMFDVSIQPSPKQPTTGTGGNGATAGSGTGSTGTGTAGGTGSTGATGGGTAPAPAPAGG